MTRPEWITAPAALLLAGSAPACAQTLERRVAQAGDRPVEFHFAARAGVCGDGRSYFRADDDGWYGTFSSDGWRAQPCERGPVRVVIVRAGREVVKVETYAGPLQRDPGAAQDLGAVGAREAAMYLLSVAASAEGRPARDALTPAIPAESTAVTPLLLAIAKDQGRGRDLRKSAISWLPRGRAAGAGAAAPPRPAPTG